MRHDIRGNLSVLKMGLEILDALAEGDEQSREVAEMMKQNLQQLEDRISEYFDLCHQIRDRQ